MIRSLHPSVFNIKYSVHVPYGTKGIFSGKVRHWSTVSSSDLYRPGVWDFGERVVWFVWKESYQEICKSRTNILFFVNISTIFHYRISLHHVYEHFTEPTHFITSFNESSCTLKNNKRHRMYFSIVFNTYFVFQPFNSIQ